MKGKKMKVIAKQIFGTQVKASEVLGMNTTRISDIIKSTQKPTIESIGILILDYKISPEWIFRAEEDEPIVFTDQIVNKEIKKLQKEIEVLQKELGDCQKARIKDLEKMTKK